MRNPPAHRLRNVMTTAVLFGLVAALAAVAPTAEATVSNPTGDLMEAKSTREFDYSIKAGFRRSPNYARAVGTIDWTKDSFSLHGHLQKKGYQGESRMAARLIAKGGWHLDYLWHNYYPNITTPTDIVVHGEFVRIEFVVCRVRTGDRYDPPCALRTYRYRR